MKAIIVAGGKGERLRPITDDIPKPMVEINGKPTLLHIIELFKENGINDFVIALCYLPEVIKSYFGNGKKFGVKIEYTFENSDNPLGTAGAITLARNLIEDTFIVTYADILRELDIREMIDFHKKMNSLATLNIYKRGSKDAKSLVKLDKNNAVLDFVERPGKDKLKGKSIWTNGSFYVFEPEIFDFIPDNKKTDFGTDIFPKLIQNRKKLYVYQSKGYFIDIGNIAKLEMAKKTFK